jgi:hypothetical protein
MPNLQVSLGGHECSHPDSRHEFQTKSEKHKIEVEPHTCSCLNNVESLNRGGKMYSIGIYVFSKGVLQ